VGTPAWNAFKLNFETRRSISLQFHNKNNTHKNIFFPFLFPFSLEGTKNEKERTRRKKVKII